MKGKPCPYDGAECTGNCLYECPPKHKAPKPARQRFRYLRIVIAAFGLALVAVLIGFDHHGPCINTINGTACGAGYPIGHSGTRR